MLTKLVCAQHPVAFRPRVCALPPEAIAKHQGSTMAKYGPKASQKVEAAVSEMKAGELRSGSGAKVTNRKQAIAIGLSEAREAGSKVPRRAPRTSKES